MKFLNQLFQIERESERRSEANRTESSKEITPSGFVTIATIILLLYIIDMICGTNILFSILDAIEGWVSSF